MKLTAPTLVPALLAALGALSLGWAAYQKYRRSFQNEDTSLGFDESKKRPTSEKTSPEHAKRPKMEESSSANGNKGAVTDISALMAAKTSIPASDQSDPDKLGQHYAKMAFKFENEGLNLKAVQDAKKYFTIDGNEVDPLVYMDFETPLARGAVRLGVFRIPLNDPASLADEVFKATKDIVQSLPNGSVVHFNRKDHYHLTVQMISHPSNPRPDSGVKGGGLDLGDSPTVIPAPLPSVLHKETSTYQEIASSTSAPELKVHSIILANSGTLLLLFTDTTGRVYELRKALAQAFPGAVENQPSILHVTLARLLSADQIGVQQRDKIVSACAKWTKKLKGKTFQPEALW